jgi:tetratricopeptide (TPR) repeat protein
MKCFKYLGLLLTLLSSSMAIAVDQVQIKATAVAADKAEIENLLNQHLDKYKRDHTHESVLLEYLGTFALDDPALDTATSDWLSRNPNSFSAQLSRGIFLLSAGWRARGGKWVSDTPSGKIVRMKKYLLNANQHFKRALELDPNNGIVYIYLMQILTAVGDDSAQERVFEQAIKANPNSFQAYWLRTNQQTPRWGGSYEVMQELIDAGLMKASVNAELRQLKGFIEKDKGTLLWEQKDYGQSLKMLTQAVNSGGHKNYYRDRAWTYEKLGNKQAAISDYTVVLDKDSNNVRALRRRAKLYRDLKQYELALKDLNRAVALEPGDAKNVFARGNLFLNLRKMAAAEKDYNHAVALKPNDYWKWRVRARFYRKQNQHKKAYEDGKRALELKPDSLGTWHEHAISLHHLRKHKELIQAAKKIIQLGRFDGKKNQKAVSWAKQTLAIAKSKGMHSGR